MTDLEFIKEFSKITVTNACKETKTNKSNLYTGVASPVKISEVCKHIIDSTYALMERYHGESEDNALQS